MQEIATRSESAPIGTVGEQIKVLRQARGLSLRKLSQGAGISAGTLSRWEAGHNLPGIPELNAVLDELGASGSQKRAVFRQLQAPRAVVQLRHLDDAGAFISLGGDLLWALRQRRGWTQAETARAVGVTQSQIARWERGDSWPKATDLHALCWHLNALSDEVEALTLHSGINETGGRSYDEREHWDNARWVEFLVNYIQTTPGVTTDLPLLVAEHQLMQLAQTDTSRQEFATALLADTYAAHARGYMYLKQFGQARHWAERGLLVTRRQYSTESNPTHPTSYWSGNILTLAAVSQEKKRPSDLRHTVRLLREWLPALLYDDPHYSWGQMALASTLALLKHFDEAIKLGQEACENVDKLESPGSRYDSALRRRDFARLLLVAGQPARAVEALSECLMRWPLHKMPADTAIPHHLLSAECLYALEDKVSMNEHISAAESLVKTHDLSYLQADLHRVAAVQKGA